MPSTTPSTDNEHALRDLYEVLEDEQESQSFLADPIWWRCYDQINRKRILNPKSAEYINLKIMFFEIVSYLIFFIILTLLIYDSRGTLVHQTREQQLRYWASCNTEAAECGLRRVTDLRTFWSWMADDLVRLSTIQPLQRHASALTTSQLTQDIIRTENIRSMQTSFPSNDFTVTHHAAVLADPSVFTIILGSIRIRQLRVGANKGCEVPKLYRQLASDCYSEFIEGQSESKEFFGSSQSPSYITSAFEWADASQTRGSSTQSGGTFATDRRRAHSYPGSGFFFDLPHNNSDATNMLRDLKDSHWIDAATRAIVVEIPTLTPNTRVLTATRILFEFSPTGAVKASEIVSSFPVHALSMSAARAEEAIDLLLHVFCLILLIASTSWILWQAKRLGAARYLAYGWNAMDVIITLFLTCYLVFKIQVYVAVASTDALSSDKIGHPDYFAPIMMKAGLSLEKAATILSCISFLSWIRLFKYFELWSSLRMLSRIILDSTGRFLTYGALLISIVFTAFSFAFYVGLGSIFPEYSSVPHAFATVIFSLMMSLRIDPIFYQPGNETVGAFLALCYILLIYFVALPIFTAIVLDAFYHGRGCEEKGGKNPMKPTSPGPLGVKTLSGSQSWRHFLKGLWSIERDVERRSPMIVFLYASYKSLRGEPVNIDSVEDIGLPDEQEIQLKLLPGIVAQRWFERKRRLSYLVDKNLRRESHTNSISDTRPTSTKAGFQSSSLKAKGMVMKLLEKTREALKLPSVTEFQPDLPSQVPEDSSAPGPRPTDLYLLDKNAVEQTTLSRVQLQRLMDEDQTLPLLLGTTRATDVIRRFKLSDDNPETSHPIDKGPEQVAELQEEWYRRLDRLEQTDLVTATKENPFCRQLMTELDKAIERTHSVWRNDLHSLRGMVGNLAEQLLELTKSLDTAQANNVAMLDKDALFILEQQRSRSPGSASRSPDQNQG